MEEIKEPYISYISNVIKSLKWINCMIGDTKPNTFENAIKVYVSQAINLLDDKVFIENKNIGKNFKIITLCGSTKFKDDFIRINKELTLKGNIVISVGVFGHSGDNDVISDESKMLLDEIHKAKIDLADEIFVINKNSYIGNSTKNEIEYAKKHNKVINYLENIEKEDK